MKHLKKYNEDLDNLGFKLVGGGEVEGQIEVERRHFALLDDGSELKFGYDEADSQFVCIVKDGEIQVAISEYEISNPFVFGDIIIVPGHDSITCYNYKTGEEKSGFIR